MPIANVSTADQLMGGTLSARRFNLVLLTLFSVTALALAIVGVYGVLSFAVSQRRRQIGTRRALGATRHDILRYFLLENWLVTGSGLALGLGLAWALNYSLVKLTPAHVQLLATQLAEQEAMNLTCALVIGGENLLAETVKWWREHFPQTKLFNEYGPTETVVGCCVYEVQPETEWSGSIPIEKNQPPLESITRR